MKRIGWMVMAVAVFGVYVVSGRGVHTGHDFFVPLSASFWQGKLYVEQMRFELHEMVSATEIRTGIYREPVDGERDKFYVIYPPVPAIVLMPFVAIWGAATNQSLVSMLIAVISVYVAAKVFGVMKLARDRVVWLTMLYAFGSSVWYHAVLGSAWYFASVCGFLFLWLAILFSLQKRQLWLIGCMVGAAYLCRYNLILTMPFFLYLTRERWIDNKRVDGQRVGQITVGVILALLLSFGYNYARYGRIGHFGYTILESRDYNLANEYARGSYNWAYAGRHVKAALWTFPNRISAFPYVIPNMNSMAIWLVFPAIVLAFLAPIKSTIVQACLVGIACLLPATVLHGGVGSSQFGYRYILDYLPFIFLLMAEGVKKRWGWWQKGLILLSILANVWGIWILLWVK